MRVDYFDRLSRDDIEAVMEHCLAALENHPTYYLVDMTGVEDVDPHIIRCDSLARFSRHPNTKWFALVGLNKTVIKLAVAILGRFTSIKQFDSVESGAAFLKEMVEYHKQGLGDHKHLPIA